MKAIITLIIFLIASVVVGGADPMILVYGLVGFLLILTLWAILSAVLSWSRTQVTHVEADDDEGINWGSVLLVAVMVLVMSSPLWLPEGSGSSSVDCISYGRIEVC